MQRNSEMINENLLPVTLLFFLKFSKIAIKIENGKIQLIKELKQYFKNIKVKTKKIMKRMQNLFKSAKFNQPFVHILLNSEIEQ